MKLFGYVVHVCLFMVYLTSSAVGLFLVIMTDTLTSFAFTSTTVWLSNTNAISTVLSTKLALFQVSAHVYLAHLSHAATRSGFYIKMHHAIATHAQ